MNKLGKTKLYIYKNLNRISAITIKIHQIYN